METNLAVTILAWWIFIEGVLSPFVHVHKIGDRRTAGEAVYASIGCVFMAIFAGLYIWG